MRARAEIDLEGLTPSHTRWTRLQPEVHVCNSTGLQFFVLNNLIKK